MHLSDDQVRLLRDLVANLEGKERRVRTAAGARRFKQPIGSVIVDKPDVPSAPRVRVPSSRSSSSEPASSTFPYEFSNGYASAKATPSGYLYNIVVSADARGQGYGTDLMNQIIEAADKFGIELQLNAREDLHDFYARFGFELSDQQSGFDEPLLVRPVKKQSSGELRSTVDDIARTSMSRVVGTRLDESVVEKDGRDKTGLLNHTGTLRVIHAQGWDKPAQQVTEEQFMELRRSGDFIAVYRGGPEGLERGLLDGIPFIGDGPMGPGTYVTTDPETAASFVAEGGRRYIPGTDIRDLGTDVIVPMLLPIDMWESAARGEQDAALNGVGISENTERPGQYVIWNTSALIIGPPVRPQSYAVVPDNPMFSDVLDTIQLSAAEKIDKLEANNLIDGLEPTDFNGAKAWEDLRFVDDPSDGRLEMAASMVIDRLEKEDLGKVLTDEEEVAQYIGQILMDTGYGKRMISVTSNEAYFPNDNVRAAVSRGMTEQLPEDHPLHGKPVPVLMFRPSGISEVVLLHEIAHMLEGSWTDTSQGHNGHNWNWWETWGQLLKLKGLTVSVNLAQVFGGSMEGKGVFK